MKKSRHRDENRSDTEPREFPDERVFQLLSARRRCETLRYLDRNGETATIDEIARHIAAKENDVDADALSSQQRKRVYIALYQSHLPTLDDASVIEYDKRRGTVTLREEATKPLGYLRFEPETELPEVEESEGEANGDGNEGGGLKRYLRFPLKGVWPSQ